MMPQPVIDMVKVIQIDIKDGTLSTTAHGRVDLFCQILLKTHTVVKACQIIFICLMLNAFLIAFGLGNIIDRCQTHLFAVHPADL